MQQNTNVTKTNQTKYKSKQTQVQQNTSITKYKWQKIKMRQNIHVAIYKSGFQRLKLCLGPKFTDFKYACQSRNSTKNLPNKLSYKECLFRSRTFVPDSIILYLFKRIAVSKYEKKKLLVLLPSITVYLNLDLLF